MIPLAAVLILAGTLACAFLWNDGAANTVDNLAWRAHVWARRRRTQQATRERCLTEQWIRDFEQ